MFSEYNFFLIKTHNENRHCYSSRLELLEIKKIKLNRNLVSETIPTELLITFSEDKLEEIIFLISNKRRVIIEKIIFKEKFEKTFHRKRNPIKIKIENGVNYMFATFNQVIMNNGNFYFLLSED